MKSLADGIRGNLNPDLILRADEIGAQLVRDEADFQLAQRLEKIRLAAAAWVDGRFNDGVALRGYPQAFAEAGLAIEPGRYEQAAAEVAKPPIKEQLLTALDHWAWAAHAEQQLTVADSALVVARMADPDVWCDQIRDKATWHDAQAVSQLAAKRWMTQICSRGFRRKCCQQSDNYSGTMKLPSNKYDRSNNLLEMEEPKPGAITRYVYDEFNMLIAVDETPRGGGQTLYFYDANRNKIAQQDAVGNLVTYKYDALNRRTETFQHAAAGALSPPVGGQSGTPRGGDPKGADLYSAAGGSAASASHWQYGYDANGNQDLIIDALGQVIGGPVPGAQGTPNRIQYDHLDRRQHVIYSAPTNLALDFQMQEIEYEHDNNGNLMFARETKSGVAAPEEYHYAYDALNRLTSITNYDGKIITYTYDRQGNRKSVTDPDGQSPATPTNPTFTTTYDYDARNRLTTATTAAGVTTYAYWEDSLLRSISYPNGTIADRSFTDSYDKADRLLLLVNRDAAALGVCGPGPVAAGVISCYAYAYDKNGNRLTQVEGHRQIDAGATETTTYTYDLLNRLTSVAHGPGGANGELSYTYDLNGNRCTEIGTDPSDPAKAVDRSYTYDRMNRLQLVFNAADSTQSVAFDYDANGNRISKAVGTLLLPTASPGCVGDPPVAFSGSAVVSTFDYGIRDELLRTNDAAGGLVKFDYDHDRMRVKKVSPATGETRYLYDRTSTLIEYAATGAKETQIKYDYGYELLSLVDAKTVPSVRQTQFYLYDGLGSTSNLANTGGDLVSYKYDAWGGIRATVGASVNPKQYTGHYFDTETGLNAPHGGPASPPHQGLVNGDFHGANAGNSDFGWSVRGGAAVVAEEAVLSEDGQLISEFSQAFIVPDGATALRFTIRSAQLADSGVAVPPDAFEVALPSAETMTPLVTTAANLANTDALLNMQQTGEVYFGPQVTIPGATTSGAAASLTLPLNVTVDLSGVPAGTHAKLYFNLLGFGAPGSVVTIDNVTLVGALAPSLDVQLDPAVDSGALGDGITNFPTVTVVGTTEPGQAVLLDLDGDGFDDGMATANASGQFAFAGLALAAGQSEVRVQATNSVGTSVAELGLTLDTDPATGALVSPVPGTIIDDDQGFVEVLWSDPGAAGLDVTSFGTTDVTITGVAVDSFQHLGGSLVRYRYADGDTDILPPGVVEVTLAAGAVADQAGNLSPARVQSFIRNTAPFIADADLVLSTASVAAGTPASLTGLITDPDPSQPHTLVIDWGDGTTDDEFILPSGVLTFGPVFHVYADDNPTGTAADDYTIAVTVSDAFATAAAQAVLSVTNVPPIASAGPDQTVAEGSPVILHGTFTDADTLDTHTFAWTVAADNGQIVSGGDRTTFSFTPTDNGTYLVTFTVTDDDGGTGADSVTINVNNVAPVIISLSGGSEGCGCGCDESVTIAGSFIDAGMFDAHLVNVDWGDGTQGPAVVNQTGGSGTFSASHVYTVGGNFTITVTLGIEREITSAL